MRVTREDTTFGADAIWLLLCGLGSALLYGWAYWSVPLLKLGTEQLYTLGTLAKERPGRGLPLSLVLGSIALLALYLAGYVALRRLLARRGGDRRIVACIVVFVPLVCALFLIFTYPFTTLDLYGYLFRGLMVGHYGANTFAQPPKDFQYNPLFWYTIWRDAPTGYGPLWEALAGAIARLTYHLGPQPLPVVAGQTDVARFAPPLLALLISFKTLGLISVLLCGVVIFSSLRETSEQTEPVRGKNDLALLGLYVWLWNPLVLWELIGGGHNDGWMLLWMLGAYGLLRRQRPRSALIALTVGALFKYPAALFGPAIVAGALHVWHAEARARGVSSWRQVVVGLAQSSVVCAIGVVVSFWPFWFGPGTFSNTMTREHWFNGSVSALIHIWLQTRVGLPSDEPWRVASQVAMFAIVGTSLWAGWRVWRQPDRLLSASMLVALCLLLASNVFQSWYITWALALVALQPQRTRLVVGAALLALGGWWTYLATDFVQPHVAWKPDTLTWQTMLLVCIYGLPLLLMLSAGARVLHPKRLRTLREA